MHSCDQGVLGPYTYSKGRLAIDHTATCNRSLRVQLLKQNNMLEVASYKTPYPVHQIVHHITYRDQAAPLSAWSQCLLDPTDVLQFSSNLQRNNGMGTIDTATHIRSLLPPEQPLAPSQKDPTPDLKRLQRLDHNFNRVHWLPSINSCIVQFCGDCTAILLLSVQPPIHGTLH